SRNDTPDQPDQMMFASDESVDYLIFAFAFRRSAQYRFIRSETARRAAADIVLARSVAALTDRRSARRRLGRASSGNVRSMAMISARSSFKITSAPARASSRSLSELSRFAALCTRSPLGR